MITLKDKAKRFIIRHRLLEWILFNISRLKGKGLALSESERRKKISLFDYESLAQSMSYSPEERVIDNNLYGYTYHLKKYAEIDTDLKGYLEHGLFWGGIVHEDERHWHYPKIITLSAQRKAEIEKQLPYKTVIPVGPYIHYAQSVLSLEEHKKIKNELGRVLLVFPTHSVKNVRNVYDKNEFIEEINRIKTDFDTVLISIYYLDAQNTERIKPYLDEGYKIVTAGHRYDLNFVARQRSHIELADMTISNSVGTHTGYCVYLNKPHYIFHQHYIKTSKSQAHKKRVENVVANTYKQRMEEQKAEIMAPFTTYRPEGLTKEQVEVVSRYWGFEDIKTARELREMFY